MGNQTFLKKKYDGIFCLQFLPKRWYEAGITTNYDDSNYLESFHQVLLKNL